MPSYFGPLKDTVVYWLHDATCSEPLTDGYVGITHRLKGRVAEHRCSRRFPVGFEVSVLFTGTRDECLKIERELRAQPGLGWNYGSGGGAGRRQTAATREKMRQSKLGIKFTEEHCQKIASALKGHKKSAEHLANASKALKGLNLGNKYALGYHHTDETKARVSKSLSGRKKSVETRLRMSAGMIGRKKSEEHKQKLSYSQMQRAAMRQANLYCAVLSFGA